MTKIQNKLMLYMVFLIVLMSAVSFWIYVSSQKSIQQYDDILQRFLVLNEISQRTRVLNNSLGQYTLHPSDDYVTVYEQNKTLLLDQRERLLEVIHNPENRYLLKNYYHMIAYMTRNMDKAFDLLSKGDFQQYAYQRSEIEQMSAWVTDTTLELIHMELTNYREFFSDVIARNRYYHTMGAGASALFLVLSIVFTYFFSNGITRPIRRLALQSRQISQGHFNSPPVPVTTRDEIGLLTETFNTMKNSIQAFVEEMKEKAVLERKLQEQTIKGLKMDRLLKEMELKTLQNQINPHFLFNTLNTLSKMAYMEGADKTGDLTVTVSKLFRYNLKQTDTAVTLADELDHVRDYVQIQKARFGDRFSFELHVEDGCIRQKIPCLTIQPIIENAFHHGIDSLTREAVIRLNVYTKGEYVVIEVTDNGVGMDEGTLSNLRQGTNPSSRDTTGIGVSNVVQRLRLYYGCEHVMDIQSRKGEGTTVRLWLPAGKGKEGQHVQTVNSR